MNLFDRLLKSVALFKQSEVLVGLRAFSRPLLITLASVPLLVLYLFAVRFSHLIYSCLLFGTGDLFATIGLIWASQFILKKRRNNVEGVFYRLKKYVLSEIIDRDSSKEVHAEQGE